MADPESKVKLLAKTEDRGVESIEVSSVYDQLSYADQISAIQRDADIDNARLGHAVSILNNHLSVFGATIFPPESNCYAVEGQKMMDEVPGPLKVALTRAMIAAARFAERCFTEGMEEAGATDDAREDKA